MSLLKESSMYQQIELFGFLMIIDIRFIQDRKDGQSIFMGGEYNEMDW